MQNPELFACLSKERKENLLGTLLFRPSIYERLYYEEEMVRKQIVCYEEFLQIVRNPQIRAATPEIDFEFEEFSANSYIELTGGIPFRHYYEKFARSLFNEEFDLIRLPRCGNRFRRTRLQLQQKFCRYARRSPLQRRPYVQPGSRTALCFQDFLPSSHQQNNTLMRIT